MEENLETTVPWEVSEIRTGLCLGIAEVDEGVQRSPEQRQAQGEEGARK